MTVDAVGLPELLGALSRAERDVLPQARQVVAKGALNVKKDWQRRWSGHPTFPALPQAVTYDTKQSRDTTEAEIGPDKGRAQGALGNIIEFGTINNPPIPGGLPALQTEEPKFVQAITDLGAELLEGP